MLTILGNLRVNSITRLNHFKDSFNSFKDISDNWLINVRGTFRDDAIDFLKENLGSKITLFNLLDDSRGWITNALEMLEKSKHNYVLIWNEDHINIAPQSIYKNIIGEMEKTKADNLMYSWWLFGKSRKSFNDLAKKIDLKRGNHIDTVDLTKEKWNMIREAGHPYFLISMCSIFRKEYLINMMKKDQRRLPFTFKKGVFKFLGLLTKLHIISPYGHKEKFSKINRILFFNKIRKYPRVTPFEIEKDPERSDVLPFRMALPKQELFACIDDNVNEEGYSLVERGLYKSKSAVSVPTKNRIDSILHEIKTVLSKIDEKQIDTLVRDILSAKKIVASGAGRVGMAVRGFVMRLKHMGLDAYILGDANVPALRQNDLFLVCSGSGETQTIYELTLIAERNQAQIALVTGNKDSRMGKVADTIVELKAPSKTKPIEGFVSIQPMTTLNEQSLGIFFDAVVLRLMDELNETHDTMWARHSNLE